MEFTTLSELLVFLAAGGAVALFGVAEAYLLKNIQVYVNLPSGVKTVIALLFSVAIAFGAKYALSFNLAGLEPWFQVALATVVAWLASQKAYQQIKGMDYGADRTK